MSRRRLGIALTAAALLGSAAPLLGSAHADTPLPAGYPTPGCFTLADQKGDAEFTEVVTVPADDPDLDILGYALETTPDRHLKAYIKVDALGDGPATTDGHRYTLDFTFNKHVFSAAGSSYSNGTGAIRDALASTGQAGHTTQLGVDVPPIAVDGVPPSFVTLDKGFKTSGLKLTFDTKNSWVIVDLPISDIEKYGGAPFTGQITAVDVKSATDEYYVSSQWDIAAPGNAAPSTLAWTIGDNKCFGPPAAKLAYLGVTKVQYTDAAGLAAKVTDSSGVPLAGVPVSFTVAGITATGNSDSHGVARASLNPKAVAGTYPVTVSFAGNTRAGAATLTSQLVVVVEKTLLTLKSVSHGTARTVTATLRDDDGHAVAGQKIVWTVNGKAAGTSTTSSTGTATLKAKAGQTVKATFAAVAGKYAGASASKKV